MGDSDIIRKLEKKIGVKIEKGDRDGISPVGYMMEDGRVTVLNLVGCGLEEFPPEILRLGNLRRLNLSSNKLTRIPREIINMDKLEYLNLNNNRLKELPGRIGYMKALKILEIAGNSLERLPTSLRRYGDIYSNFKKLKVNRYGWVGSSLETLRVLEEYGRVDYV